MANRLPLVRLIAIATVCAAVVVGVWLWIDNLKRDPAARLAAGFLVVLQATYVGLVLILIPAIPLALRRLIVARRARRPAPRAARILLLGVSLLFTLCLGEVVAALIGDKLVPPIVPPPPTTLAVSDELDQRTVLDFLRDSPATPLPSDYPDRSDPEAVDIVVVGESSAEGIPFTEWHFSMGEYIRRRLSESNPGRSFRSRGIAISGSTLRRQLQLFASLARRPELVVVYCGHNEFSAVYHWDRGPKHYDDGDDPTPLERAAMSVERVSPLFALMRRVENHRRVAIIPTRGSRRALVDVPVHTPEEYRAILADFASNLDRLVAHSVKLGALTILVIPPANDAGFEPNRSYLPASTSRAERQSFADAFRRVRAIEESDPDRALRDYQALLGRGESFAELHFRIGRLVERSGRREEAARSYAKARDLDGLPQRLPSDFHEVYRAVAAKYGCPLVDGPALLRRLSATGQLDGSLFQDAMHPSLRGHAALTRAVLGEIHRRGAFGLAATSPPPRVVPDELAAEFGIDRSAWRRICLWTAMFHQMTEPLRYDPSVRIDQERRFLEAARRIERGENPDTLGLPGIGHAEPLPDLPIDR